MRLALRELRRRPGRFVTATAILALLALLLCFLGGLLDGLVNSATAAYRAQDGDLVVFSSDAQDSIVRSRIPPERRDQVAAVDGVEATGGLGVALLGARVPGNAPRDLADVALFGYEIPPDGVPAVPAEGEAWADEVLEASGVEEGDELLLGPARTPVTVAGFVTDTTYAGQGSLWTDPATWSAALAENRPGSQLAPGTFQALVVQLADDADPDATATRIDEATGGATSTLTPQAAAEALGGVTEQRRTFNQIIGVTLLISVVVVALFFALITVERTALYGVLKAVGARSRTLFAGLVVQALVVTGVASLVGGGLAVAFGLAVPPGALPFELTAGRLATNAAFLLAAAVVGCAFSLRRVVRIDPASAIGGTP